MSVEDLYMEDNASGINWDLWLGDSCKRMSEIPSDSIGMSIYSPPFASLFTYSPSPRDLGNSASRAEFFFRFDSQRANNRVSRGIENENHP